MKKVTTFYDFSAESLKGEMVDMKTFQGKVILVVNTASKCGFTPQYAGLEALYKKYKDQGLVILGFPCDQFGHQEPGEADDISKTCYINYGVTFPMFAKIEVNGEGEHPIYTYLKKSVSGLLNDKIKWNFTKFLIDRNGQPVERFSSQKKPENIAPNIEKLL